MATDDWRVYTYICLFVCVFMETASSFLWVRTKLKPFMVTIRIGSVSLFKGATLGYSTVLTNLKQFMVTKTVHGHEQLCYI